MINSKFDFNKAMFVIGCVLIVIFGGVVLRDYIAYDAFNNSAPFFYSIIVRAVEFLLPGVMLVWLYNENTHLKQKIYNITSSAEESKTVKEYKIAQISDFHNTNSKRLKNSIIKSLKEVQPNIIVITGDLIDSRRTSATTAYEFLKKITDIAPVYYVLGNHESRKENIQEITERFLETGVNILRNEKVELFEGMELVGLDDANFFSPTEQEALSKEVKEKLKHKLQGIITEKDKYIVLITHRPELLDIYSEVNVNLVLTGHAHGGQIRLPFVGGLYAPSQGILPKYSKGKYAQDKTEMIVSGGIGNSGFPFRVNNKPELVIINIK